MLIGAVALLFTSVSTTPVIAGAGDFAGPYIAIQASASGVEGEGKHTDSNGAETTGKTGFLAPIVGLELGYNIPLAENLFVDFGARFSQLDGDVSADDVDNVSDVNIKSRNQWSVTLSPSITFSETSAVFFKFGYSEVGLKAWGNIDTANPDMSGETFAIGTTSLFNSGVYVKTEAGVHLYDNVNLVGLGSDNNGGTEPSIDIEPTMAYGSVSIGYKF